MKNLISQDLNKNNENFMQKTQRKIINFKLINKCNTDDYLKSSENNTDTSETQMKRKKDTNQNNNMMVRWSKSIQEHINQHMKQNLIEWVKFFYTLVLQ